MLGVTGDAYGCDMSALATEPTISAVRVGAPLSVSYSSLSVFESCPRRYELRYVERVPGEVEPAQFALGSAVHKAFEAYGRARMAAGASGTPQPGFDMAWAAFTEALEASGCTPDEIARFRERGAPILERFIECDRPCEADIITVEAGFGLELGEPEWLEAQGGPAEPARARLVGYIDRVNRRPDGSIEVIDYKTCSPWAQEWVDRDLQLTAYAFAAAEGALRDPATGLPLPAAARLGIYFAEAGITLWTTRSEADLAAFRERLGAAIRTIRAADFPAQPRPGACRWCEYRGTCPSAQA